MKQLSLSTAILPLGIENVQENQIDIKTVFEQILHDAFLQVSTQYSKNKK